MAVTQPAGGLSNDAFRALFLKPAATPPPPPPPPPPSTEVTEGAAVLCVDGTFFNRKGVLQRDLTVLALRTWLRTAPQPATATVLDAMAGSGVRALRYLLEVPGVDAAVANDSSEAATAAIGANALRSGLQQREGSRYQTPRGGRLEVSHSDATACMHANAGRFDAVCLDPCGSVAELLPAAVRCLRRGGLLCASATDLGALSGRWGEQCAARYGAQPLRSGGRLAPELAMRILLGCVARAAGAAGRRVRPLVGVTFADFFVRVIVELEAEGEHAEADAAADDDDDDDDGGGIGLAYVCVACGASEVQRLGRPQLVGRRCAQCGGAQEAGGPIWLGATSDAAFVAAMMRGADEPSAESPSPSQSPPLASAATLWPLLRAVAAEAALSARGGCALPLPLPALCRAMRCAALPMATAIAALRDMGHGGAATHWSEVALRPAGGGAHAAAWAMLRAWARLHPLRAGADGDADGDDGGNGGDGEAAGAGAPPHEGAAGASAQRARMVRARESEASMAVSFAAASALHEQKRRRLEAPPRPPPQPRPPQPPQQPQPLPVAAAARLMPTAAAGEEEATGGEVGGCKFGGDGCSFPFAEEARAHTETLHVRADAATAAEAEEAAEGAAEARGPPRRTFASVAEAVRVARPGALLLLAPGVHTVRRALLLDKPITLRAAAPAAAAGARPGGGGGGGSGGGGGVCTTLRRTEGRGSVVIVDVPSAEGAAADAATVELSGLEIAQLQPPPQQPPPDEGAAAAADEPPGYAVLVRRGAAALTRCGVASDASGGVFVSASASCELRACQLRRAAAHGVLVSGTSYAALRHCHVRDTGAAGLEVRGRARALLHGCRVHHAKRSGVFAGAFSELRVDGCNVFNCGAAAVECSGHAELVLRASRCHHNQRGGVLVMGRAQAKLEANALYANSMAGLTVRGGARAVAERNIVTDGRASGVYALEDAQLLLLDNEVRGNRLSGLEVGGGGGGAMRLEARRNQLHGNGAALCIAPAALPRCTLDENALEPPCAAV